MKKHTNEGVKTLTVFSSPKKKHELGNADSTNPPLFVQPCVLPELSFSVKYF